MALAAVGAAVFALLVLAAGGSRTLPGTTRSLSLSWTFDVVAVIQVGIGVLIIGAILWSLIASRRQREEQPSRRRAPRRRRPPWAVLLVLVAISLLIWLIPRQHRETPEEAAPDFTISEVDFLPVENLGNAWPLLVLAAGTMLAAFAVSQLGSTSADEDDDIDPGPLLADALDEVLEDLASTDDPRAAIITAYRTIERELTGAGLGRRSSEAPREYLRSVLAAANVAPEAIITLTDLFEQARFSLHPMDDTDRRAAIEAMESVRSALAVPR